MSDHEQPAPFEFVAMYSDRWPFTAGEIILVDAAGREPMGEGRKPAKWDADYDYFPTAAEAVAAVAAKGLTPGLPHELSYTAWRAVIPPFLTLLDALGL